ncbi:MAG: polysaccharide biosynthesis/export family protein, partial [Terriglobales bacterium]
MNSSSIIRRRAGLGCVLAPALALSLAAQAPNPLHLLSWIGGKDQPSTSAGARAGANPAVSAYVIGPGDVLAIDVWKEPEISQTLPVRPDGAIALPLAGTLRASGA